ncbi:MAG: hypothetical protein IT430_13150 [Phycisphaerales bacterium]|nr:hypothetical protein [Phycisphaerales bacterium]
MRRFIMTLAATAVLGGAAAVASAQDMQARSEALGKLLNTELPTVDFSGHEFRTVVGFLSELANLDILAKWNEEGFGEGFDPNAKITLQLKNPTSLLTILELVMKQATDEETTWVLGDGYVEIGTKSILNKNKYVRIYPVRELLFVPPRFDNAPQLDLNQVLQSSSRSGQGGGGGSSGQFFRDDQGDENNVARGNEADQANELIDIITSIVEPTQWESLGGDGGSIRYFRGNLIINASDYLHRQVGGYPFAPARTNGARSSANAGGRGLGLANAIPSPRYVTLTGDWGVAKIVDIEESSIPVLVGGRVIDSGDPGR